MTATTPFVALLYDYLLSRSISKRAVTMLSSLLPAPQIRIMECEIPIAGLPTDLEGIRVLHVSDLHLREGSELAMYLPDVVGSIRHDMTVYTGDFVDTDAGTPRIEEILRKVPTRESYAVLGNHDHWKLGGSDAQNDVRALCEALNRCGVTVLRNNSASALGGRLHVVGTDDPVTCLDDLGLATQTVPAGAWTLLLAHTPDIVLRIRDWQPGLVLAGHTHGGQIRLPLLGPLVNMSALPRRKVKGHHHHNGVPFFVTCGIGYAGVDLRLGCPPEVALLTLVGK